MITEGGSTVKGGGRSMTFLPFFFFAASSASFSFSFLLFLSPSRDHAILRACCPWFLMTSVRLGNYEDAVFRVVCANQIPLTSQRRKPLSNVG